MPQITFWPDQLCCGTLPQAHSFKLKTYNFPNGSRYTQLLPLKFLFFLIYSCSSLFLGKAFHWVHKCFAQLCRQIQSNWRKRVSSFKRERKEKKSLHIAAAVSPNCPQAVTFKFNSLEPNFSKASNAILTATMVAFVSVHVHIKSSRLRVVYNSC